MSNKARDLNLDTTSIIATTGDDYFGDTYERLMQETAVREPGAKQESSTTGELDKPFDLLIISTLDGLVFPLPYHSSCLTPNSNVDRVMAHEPWQETEMGKAWLRDFRSSQLVDMLLDPYDDLVPRLPGIVDDTVTASDQLDRREGLTAESEAPNEGQSVVSSGSETGKKS